MFRGFVIASSLAEFVRRFILSFYIINEQPLIIPFYGLTTILPQSASTHKCSSTSCMLAAFGLLLKPIQIIGIYHINSVMSQILTYHSQTLCVISLCCLSMPRCCLCQFCRINKIFLISVKIVQTFCAGFEQILV